MFWVSDTFYNNLNRIHVERWETDHEARLRRQWETENIRRFSLTVEPLRAPVEDIIFALEEEDFYVNGLYTGWTPVGAAYTVHHQFRYQIYRATQPGNYSAYLTRYQITANQDPQFQLEVILSVDADTQRPFFVCRNLGATTCVPESVSGNTVEEFEHVLAAFLEIYLRRNTRNARRIWHTRHCYRQLASLRIARRRAANVLDDLRRTLPLIIANSEDPDCYMFQDRSGHTRFLAVTLDGIASFLQVEIPHLTQHAENYGADRIRINALRYSDLIELALEQATSDQCLRHEPLYEAFINWLMELETLLEQIADRAQEIYPVSPA